MTAADCRMCGETFLVLSADDYEDLLRAHHCEGELIVPRDLLRRLLLAAERGDVTTVLELHLEIARLPRPGTRSTR